MEKDKADIDRITARFFDLFTNKGGRTPQIHAIKEFFIPRGILINNSGDQPAIYDLDGFIAPREKLLTDGSLVDFSESETAGKTEIQGNIAQRSSRYEKSGILNGATYEGKGTKFMHFIKVADTWMMSAVAWCDDV